MTIIPPPTPRQTIIKNIRLRLGGGKVGVELTPDHFEFAISNALARYRMRSSNAVEESFLTIDVQPDVQIYTLPREVQDVKDIYRRNLGNTSSGSSIDPFALSFTNNIYMACNPGGMGGGGGTLATYEFGMAYQKLLGRMFGADIVFNYNPSTKKLYMERKFTATESVLLHVFNEKPEDVLLTDPYAHNWLQDYATAEAKMMLGEIRGKFAGGIGGPQGNITLNGNDLKTEAKETMERLEEEIKNFTDGPFGLPFIVG